MAKLAPLRSEGLELAIFPSGDFGNQELADDASIADFAKGKGFEGVIFSKGPANDRPVFQLLQKESGSPPIEWNFKGLYIVSKTGEVVAVPDGADVEEIVRAKLAE